MDKLLRRIYEEILYYEKEGIEADRRINQELAGLSEKYADRLTKEDFEELKSLLCQISLMAQEEGFLLAIKYMCKLFKLLDMD